MASQTVNLDNEQLQYILRTKEEAQSISARIREIVDKGIESEQTETA